MQLDENNNAVMLAETLSDDEELEEVRRHRLFLRQNEDNDDLNEHDNSGQVEEELNAGKGTEIVNITN